MADDIWALVLYPAVTLLHLVGLLCMCVRNPSVCPNMLSYICERVLRGSCLQGSAKNADSQQDQLQERLDEIRVESVMGFIQVWVFANGTFATLATVRIVAGLPRLSTGLEAILFASSYVSQGVLLLFPQAVNKKTLGAVFFVCEASVMLFAGFHALTNATVFAHYYTLFVLFRFTLSIAYPVPSCYLCTNVLWGALSIFARLRADTGGGIPAFNIIGNEVMVFVCHSYLVWKYAQLQANQVRSDLKASGYLKSKNTMERLLAEMCDAVVELDSNLGIKEVCPKLAALLLRDDTGKAMQGEDFANLAFSETDRKSFCDFVERRTVPLAHEQNFSETEQASSMYLSLRDAYGTPVSVQVFHSCHHTPPDEVCHIVGVHEVERDDEGADIVQDTLGGQAGRAGQADGPRNARDQTSLQAHLGDETESIASSVSLGTSVTSAGTTFALAPVIREQDMLAPISVLFSALSMEVFACTMDMKALTGPMVYRGNLSDYIANYTNFHGWVDYAVNEFLNAAGGVPNPDSVQPTQFQLRLTSPTYRKHAKLEFHADAYIIECQEEARVSEMGVEMPEDWDDDERFMLCVLELRNVEPRWRRKRSARNLRVIAGTPPRPRTTTSL